MNDKNKYILHADLKITSLCNNCCIHCSESDEKERNELAGHAYESRTAEIFNRIVEYRNQGIEVLTITGGEPTLRKDIIEIVRKSVSLHIFTGFQTNARLLAYPEFARQISMKGVHFVAAIQGHRKEIHDSITQADGSFDQSEKGILNLLDLKSSISINTVISGKNAQYLHNIISEFYQRGIKKFNFVYPRMKGNALLHADEVIVPYGKIKDQLLDIVEFKNKKSDIWIKFENIPSCIIQGNIALSSDSVLKNIKSRMRTLTLDDRDWSHDRVHEIKMKIQKCSTCRHNQICEGILREYAARFGEEEFVPC
jgi:MoaA/NifB/PqqE/SkfB family radical SAM enzyme